MNRVEAIFIHLWNTICKLFTYVEPKIHDSLNKVDKWVDKKSTPKK